MIADCVGDLSSRAVRLRFRLCRMSEVHDKKDLFDLPISQDRDGRVLCCISQDRDGSVLRCSVAI